MVDFKYNCRGFSGGEYRHGVVDGDTIDLVVDQGFHDWSIIRIRLQGVDTAEIFGVSHDSEEYHKGLNQKLFVIDWMEAASSYEASDYDGRWPLMYVSEEYDRTGKYGRNIGRLVRKKDGQDLGERLKERFDL